MYKSAPIQPFSPDPNPIQTLPPNFEICENYFTVGAYGGKCNQSRYLRPDEHFVKVTCRLKQ